MRLAPSFSSTLHPADSEANRTIIARNGYSLEATHQYVAPMYPAGEIGDPHLLAVQGGYVPDTSFSIWEGAFRKVGRLSQQALRLRSLDNLHGRGHRVFDG